MGDAASVGISQADATVLVSSPNWTLTPDSQRRASGNDPLVPLPGVLLNEALGYRNDPSERAQRRPVP